MSHTSSSSIYALAFAAALAGLLAACAQGAEGTGDDDPIDAKVNDARNTGPDARLNIDARIVDGPISQPDASILPDGGFDFDGGGLTCTSSPQCGAGMCCFMFPPGSGQGICVAGMEQLGICLPS